MKIASCCILLSLLWVVCVPKVEGSGVLQGNKQEQDVHEPFIKPSPLSRLPDTVPAVAQRDTANKRNLQAGCNAISLNTILVNANTNTNANIIISDGGVGVAGEATVVQGEYNLRVQANDVDIAVRFRDLSRQSVPTGYSLQFCPGDSSDPYPVCPLISQCGRHAIEIVYYRFLNDSYQRCGAYTYVFTVMCTQRPITARPTAQPSRQPSFRPSNTPSHWPSMQPSATPTAIPSTSPSAMPSVQPTSTPTSTPSMIPSHQPSQLPSQVPSVSPSHVPSSSPSSRPSSIPTVFPSVNPTARPSVAPSNLPSVGPSRLPSTLPTALPSAHPSQTPSIRKTAHPSASPSARPTATPSIRKTAQPSASPSARPTATAIVHCPRKVCGTGPSAGSCKYYSDACDLVLKRCNPNNGKCIGNTKNKRM